MPSRITCYPNGSELVKPVRKCKSVSLSRAQLNAIEVALRLRVEARAENGETGGVFGGAHRKILSILTMCDER